MTALDRENLTIEANHLMANYFMSYGQIAKYIKKHYGFQVHRTTVFRWLN